MKYATDVTAGTVTVSFDDARELILDWNRLDSDTQRWLGLYGLKQKGSDSAASALKMSAETGRDIEDQRFVMMTECWEALLNGQVTRERGEGSGRTSYLVQAIVALYGKSDDEAAKIVAEKSKDDRKALEAAPKIAAWIATEKARVAAERAASLQEKGEDEEALPSL